MKTILIFLLGTLVIAQAQLAVTVSPPRIIGNKAVIPLAMKNHFPQEVESARAVVFLLHDQGKVAGQATRWVIGGTHTNGLAPGATNGFQFVITSDRPFATTNLTAKITFSRVVLAGGKLANAAKDVTVTPATK